MREPLRCLSLAATIPSGKHEKNESPQRRQEEVAELPMSIEAQDKSDYRLNDEQISELRRRRAEANPKTLTLAEFDERLRRFGL